MAALALWLWVFVIGLPASLPRDASRPAGGRFRLRPHPVTNHPSTYQKFIRKGIFFEIESGGETCLIRAGEIIRRREKYIPPAVLFSQVSIGATPDMKNAQRGSSYDDSVENIIDAYEKVRREYENIETPRTESASASRTFLRNIIDDKIRELLRHEPRNIRECYLKAELIIMKTLREESIGQRNGMALMRILHDLKTLSGD